MNRWLVLPITLLAVLAVSVTPALADEGGGGDNENGDNQNGDNQDHAADFGPFASASTDSGTCGPDWANDTFNRSFTVSRNADGTFAVREDFTKGRFVTTGPASPGACEGTATPHGTVVTAGVKGRFHGYLAGTVTGGTFNEHGCDAGGCDTTSGFTAHVFGAGASYTCVSGGGACSFFFTYSAGDQGLKFHHWINASADLGGNRGDIATA